MSLAALFPLRRRPGRPEADAGGEAARLVAADGPLSRYPGPVVCAAPGGRVLAANRAGERLAGLLSGGGAPALAGAVDRALATGAAVETAIAPGEPGETTVVVTVVPVAPGHAAGGCAVLLGRDATLDRNLRAALVESRQRYRTLVDISSDFAWETDRDGIFVFVSPRGALGYTAEELVGRDPRELVLEPASEAATAFSTAAPVEDLEIWFERADGRPACLLAAAAPVLDETGAWLGARGVCRDVTEARERDAALARAREREQLLAYIVRQIRDEIEPENMMNAAAAATARALGASACRIDRAKGADFAVAAAHGDVPGDWTLPPNLTGHGGMWSGDAGGRPVLAMATRYHHRVNGAIALWRPVNGAIWDEDDLALLSEVANQLGIAVEQLANHEALERLSRTDTLTGLLNRRMFFEEVARRMSHAGRTGRPGALCYVDLDNFKLVNDLNGHHRGDEALRAVADILRRNTRVSDLVSRLGGDEFAVWLEETGGEGAAAKARELLGEGAGLAGLSGEAARPLGFSIGVAVHEPANGEGLDDLTARADAAMYAVKRAGKGGFRVAEPAAPAPAPAATGD